MKYAAIASVLILATLPAGAAEKDERKPVDPGAVATLRQFRAWDFASFRERLPSFGASGGFFPKILSDETAAGIVVGMCRRYPDRIGELLPTKVKLQKRFRRSHYAALCAGGGDRALALLRALPEKDEDLVEFLGAIDGGASPRRSLLELDPWDPAQRQLLVGVLLVHSDAFCATRLLTCLARTPGQIEKTETGAGKERRLRAREEVLQLLGGLAAIDASLYRLVRCVRLLAAPALHGDLDWILAQGAASWDQERAER